MKYLAAALAALLLTAAGPLPNTRVALPDGRRIALQCSGSGSPTVIFDAGFQAWSFAWDKVAPAVAAPNRACVYDRAGLGASDPGPEPRDGASIAADLAAALKAARIAPPYVLVGHSAGGLYARAFADRRPAEVVGMVLVDPSVEAQFAGNDRGASAKRVAAWRACAAAAAARTLPSPELPGCTPPSRPGVFGAQLAALAGTAGYWNTLASEYENLPRTAMQLRSARQSYGDLPLVVLTAGGRGEATPEQAAARTQWAAWHAALAARSTRGQQRIVAGSGHLIMRERPEVVVAAIAEVAARR